MLFSISQKIPDNSQEMYLRTLFEVPKITCPIVLVHLEPLKEDNLSIKYKTAEFIFLQSVFYSGFHCTSVCEERERETQHKSYTSLTTFSFSWRSESIKFKCYRIARNFGELASISVNIKFSGQCNM